MRRSLSLSALVITSFAVALGAQQRAPQIDTIAQDALRADLFFLAGDAMKGRLTDTDENRAAADYIRSRFERAGLKPAAADNSFFQPFNLMTPALGDGNALDVFSGASGDGPSRHLRQGQEF